MKGKKKLKKKRESYQIYSNDFSIAFAISISFRLENTVKVEVFGIYLCSKHGTLINIEHSLYLFY